MAHYRATVETELAPADAFAYLSDFANAEEWDPGTVHTQRLDVGPVALGSQVRLRARFLGRESELVYAVVELREHELVRLRGENAAVVSEDVMTFAPTGSGTRITYDATLRVKGPLAIVDPLLGLAFRRMGDAALHQLRETLARKSAQRGAAA